MKDLVKKTTVVTLTVISIIAVIASIFLGVPEIIKNYYTNKFRNDNSNTQAIKDTVVQQPLYEPKYK